MNRYENRRSYEKSLVGLNGHQRIKMNKRSWNNNSFNEKKQGEYIMRALKTIISILHRGFDKIKEGGRVMVLDEKSAEKLYSRLHLVESKKKNGTNRTVHR